MKVAADPAVMAGLEDRQYTVKEVAALFEVREGQVRIWIRSGQLKATQESRKQGFRIPRESLVTFAVKRYHK